MSTWQSWQDCMSALTHCARAANSWHNYCKWPTFRFRRRRPLRLGRSKRGASHRQSSGTEILHIKPFKDGLSTVAKAEKKENKEHAEVGSTTGKKKQPPKKKVQQTIIAKLDEEKEPTSKLIMADSNESTYLSPVKKVIDLCNTPLRELTGFTLNSASVATSSISSSSSPSSLSSNSPARSDTPDGQSSITESAKTSDGNSISSKHPDTPDGHKFNDGKCQNIRW
ncbi:hypothetical protein LSTR_LSTR012584 [Laodelphax striatellus]|uniref:Uncharacterized protein n=1 Tax=Laodelphax striatellus TaxID=195883 RepID=A0A482XAB7_LAOST|nr:hypothetical protein LSTR_LSTR012584 [Laodelphax striatellus]